MTTYPEIAGRLRAVAAQLWAEWQSELSAFLREKFAGRWSGNREFVRLEMGADEIALDLVGAHGVRPLGRASAADIGNLALAMPEARAVLDKAGDVVIQFPRQSVLHLQLELPAASQTILRKAVAFELEQLSPIGSDKLYFDFSATKAPSTARIELRAIKREVVDEAVTLCHASNLGVSGIFFEADDREADWRAFPIDWPAFLRRQWARRGALCLGAAALFLLVAVLFAVNMRGATEASQMLTQLEAVNEQAAVVHRMQRDIRDLHTQIEFPAAQKTAPLLLDVLSQVTKALPDGTWLTEFEIKDGKAHIRGFSKSPSDLIGDIDQSPYLANAQFGAPLEGAQDGTERFDLSFDVKPAVRR
ncbi:MAG: PilN domain-containing protein [Rhizomicrobium sp.]